MIERKPKKCKGINRARSFEGCGEVTLNRTHGLCQKCFRDWLHNTPEGKQKTLKSYLNASPLKPARQKIGVRSKKRLKQEQEYKTVRDKYMKLNPLCVRCGKKATDIHHMRKRNGKRLLETKYFMSICRQCHGWVHANPEESKKMGWLLRQ